MRHQLLFSCILFLILIFLSSSAHAQMPTPAPSGPTNITKILEKAGQFTALIRLMQSTQEANQINTQLNSSSQGLTIFAPTDNAFASLKAGTLNSLTDQQKVQLLQFHILPNFISTTQFQTVSNPLRTQAGNSAAGEFPLNVTTSGNQVNLTTGVNTASVDNTIYTDGQLAVYQVSQVLLPLDMFRTSASPAASPTSSKPEKDVPLTKAPAGSTDGASVDANSAGHENVLVSFCNVLLLAIAVCFFM